MKKRKNVSVPAEAIPSESSQRAFVGVQREGLRQREAVVDVDAEVVGGKREGAGIDDQPGGRVD